MSNRNIPYPYKWNIYKLFCDVMKLVKIDIQRGWVNGRPVLLNGNVYCPMCEIYHENNSYCQQP